ncbi:pyridoxal phosphate-dependent transferase [Immersiella caudata]|uniref:Pyridoxal phosphate-dependent transferase n=1 Tax=Immersiella caudata TaxID=314043 RepID=A0AA39WFR2_9PEZI|nr:pyridoxal phosphate-dependent transferase [Immersiella caudata]
MPSILDSYPEYRTTYTLDHLRSTEYSHLDAQDHVYLDYTGSGLASQTQYLASASRLTTTVYGNPHSVNPTSEAATALIENTRARILQHFNADPHEYAVIFTANATGAARLVAESYPFRRGRKLVLTADNHNSINGIREFARVKHARTVYVPTIAPELRVDGASVVQALKPRLRSLFSCRGGRDAGKNGLFAYPAQSNFSGVRHPLSWVEMAQQRGYDVLLDAAAYVPTGQLDLSVVKPEFVTVSWYKVFGYPTGVGCLIAKREALERLDRPWFSGGTVTAAAVGIPFHRIAPGGEGFEDGTVNFLAIPDVKVGIDWIRGVGTGVVETRVKCLTGWFLERLLAMKHSDGHPMAVVYGPTDMKMRGGTVSFNLLDSSGKVIDERLVAYESSAAMISLRTGCFCNPGVGEAAFGLDVRVLKTLHREHNVHMDRYIDVLGLPSGGAIRVSFGIASTARDVDKFFGFAEKTYRDRHTTSIGLPPREHC